MPEVKELRVIFKKAGFMKDSNMIRDGPVIDIRECSDCGTCLELCPAVFRKSEASGIIEARELSQYPVEEILETIHCCPKSCITWEKDVLTGKEAICHECG